MVLHIVCCYLFCIAQSTVFTLDKQIWQTNYFQIFFRNPLELAPTDWATGDGTEGGQVSLARSQLWQPCPEKKTLTRFWQWLLAGFGLSCCVTQALTTETVRNWLLAIWTWGRYTIHHWIRTARCCNVSIEQTETNHSCHIIQLASGSYNCT